MSIPSHPNVTLPADLVVADHALDSVRLHVASAGPIDGPPVVLVHGFPETWWSWRHNICALTEAGFRVHAVDLRGYGLSQREGPFDIDTLAADLDAFIRTLPTQRAHVIGHDWGGAVAWHIARRHRDRIDRLVIINVPPAERLLNALFARPRAAQIKKSWYIFFFQFPLFPERLLLSKNGGGVIRAIKSGALDRTHFSTAELEPFREAILRPGAATSMLGPYRDNGRLALADLFRGRRPGTSSAERATPITTPTTLLWGDADPALDFDILCEGLETLVPDLTVHRLRSVGHFAHAERPDVVNPLMLHALGAGPARG